MESSTSSTSALLKKQSDTNAVEANMTNLENTNYNDNDEIESSTSASSNGKLKIDITEDSSSSNQEATNNDSNKEKVDASMVISNDSTTNPNNQISNTESVEPISSESLEKDDENKKTPKNNNKRTTPRKSINRGLDGGYWSRIGNSSEAASSERRKRPRTLTDRLDLSVYKNNLSADDSFISDDTVNTTNGASVDGDGDLNSEDSELNSNKIAKKSNISATAVLNKSTRLFKAKSFLAVRNESETFFLCRAINAVYEDSKKCKIQWLEDIGTNKYKFSSTDMIQPLSIISKVQVKRVQDENETNLIAIEEKDLEKVKSLLEKIKEAGHLTVDSSELDESDLTTTSDEIGDTNKNKKKRNFLDNEELFDKEDNHDDVTTKKIKKRSDKEINTQNLKNSNSKKDAIPIISPQSTKKTNVNESSKKIALQKDVDTDQLDSSSSDSEFNLKPAKKIAIQSKDKNPSPKLKKVMPPPPPTVPSPAPAPNITSPQSKKRRLTKVVSNRLLEENSKVKVYEKDPFFEDTDPEIKLPFISSYVQSKLAFKAIYLNDIRMLKHLIDDVDRVSSVHIGKAVYNKWIPAEYAVYMENQKALEVLIDDFVLKSNSKRTQMAESMFEKFTSTGTYNPRSLGGIQFVRKLTESRGAKEGNNAFTKDQETLDLVNQHRMHRNSESAFFKRLFDLAFEYGSSIEMFDFLMLKWKSLDINKASSFDLYSYSYKFIYENIIKIILFGHRKLAAHVLENAPAGTGFNAVHAEVLKVDNDADLKCQLRANMCTKKPFANDLVTPIHCASINPNVKYLKTLLSITQDFNISDKRGRKPVHFAAVCEGPSPLEYLISRVSPYELDSMGNTPLHYACLSNRSMNVEILLNFAQKKQEDDSALTSEMLIDNKYGLGGINKPNKRGQLPIHLAISRNSYKCVSILLKYGCNVEYPLPNSMGKITPLMYACQLGHYKIIKLLIENNAKVEARDRFQRTAVIHAAMCGHVRPLTHLLNMGANPNVVDSSGNSCLHYACAYGWFYSMRAILDAGANVNVANDWKLTPFGVAFLKGHVGICDQLLLMHKNQIDINFRTEDGETLVMLAVSSTVILNDASIEQLHYIVNKLGGNSQLVDSKGNNAFHYLASNKVDKSHFVDIERDQSKSVEDLLREQELYRFKMADVLLKSGCNPNTQNNELQTSLFTAIECGNFKFARYLLIKKDTNCKITSQQDPNGKTLLSLMADKCLEMDVCYIIFGDEKNSANILNENLSNKYAKEFETMAKIKNENGHTPFQIACIKLNEFIKQNSIPLPESLVRFIIFLYKDCKSNPNELIIEVKQSISESESDEKSVSTPIFKLIDDKCINLLETLYNLSNSNLNLIKFDLNFYDSDGMTSLLKSVVLKQTKFALKLIEIFIKNYGSTTELAQQICKNSSTYLNENILQISIRNNQLAVFTKVIDAMSSLANNHSNFSSMLKHKNTYSQNILHVFAEHEKNHKDHLLNSDFLNEFAKKINSYFAELNTEAKNILFHLAVSKDKLGRNPLHLCLLNSDKNRENIDLEIFFAEQIFNFITTEDETISKMKNQIFCEKDLFGRIPMHYLFYSLKQTNNAYASKDLNLKPSLYFGNNDDREKITQIDPVELLAIIIKNTDKSFYDEKDIYGYTSLHYGALRGSTICCTMLISKGCDFLSRSVVENTNDFTDSTLIGNTPLSTAIFFKRESCVLAFLRCIEQIKIDKSTNKSSLKDYYYLHPLDYIKEDDQETIEKEPCLKWSTSLNEKNLYPIKRIPLYQLILSYKWEGISWLILGDLESYGLDYFESILRSILSYEFSLALRLVEKLQRQINNQVDFINLLNVQSKNDNNRTLLHAIANLDLSNCQSQKQILIRILERMFQVSPTDKEAILPILNIYLAKKDSFGSTALHYACLTHNFEVLDFFLNFLEVHSSANSTSTHLTLTLDAHQQSAYSLLFWNIGRKIYSKEEKEKIKNYTFKYLPIVNNGNNPENNYQTLEKISKAYYPFIDASNFNSEESLVDLKNQLINDYPPQNVNKRKLVSPLLYAINRQSFDMCKFLLKDLSFDVNTTDSNKVSALAYAVQINNINLCKLLLNIEFETVETKKINPDANLKDALSKAAGRMKALFTTMQAKKSNSEEDEDSSELSESEDEKPPISPPQSEILDHNTTFNNSNGNVSSQKLEVKSNIILNHLDSKQQSIFHHLACSLEYGSFQNIEICKLLFNAFGQANLKLPLLSEFLKRVDSNILTASDYAIKNGNIELFEEFSKVLNKTTMESNNLIVEIKNKLNKFSTIDNNWSVNSIDFSKDAELFLKKYSETINSNVKILEKENDYFNVDPLSNMDKIGCLVWDQNANLPYDIILTKTDVSYGLYGMHNFYKMQLITHSFNHNMKIKNSINDSINGNSDIVNGNGEKKIKYDQNQMCVLFTRWGRIGDPGQYQRTPFSNFQEAKDEFCKIFKQKTGNDFIDTVIEKKKQFENKPRRYNLVKFESRVRPKLKDINFNIFESNNSTTKNSILKNQIDLFEKSVFKKLESSNNDYRSFWTDLLDVEFLKNQIHSKSKLSASYLPLTQLSVESIEKASDILSKQLKPLIERRMELEKLSKKGDLVEYMTLLDKINKYSNDFYELIPQMNYNYEKLVPISNERELDAQFCALNQLINAQIACRILMGAKYALNDSIQKTNPFDYVYKAVKCKFELMNPNENETKYILRYIWTDKTPKIQIKSIFKFERYGEQERFDKESLSSGFPKIKNRILLWHGTGTENLLSIMCKGLKIAPNDAKWTGQRFGQGIYFSDSFLTSSYYGKNGKHHSDGYTRNYMLLCEVAMGKTKELRSSHETIETIPVGFDSVKALGRKEPNPNNNVNLPNGCIIPLGEKQNCKLKPGEFIYMRNLDNNQYVVYNESQVCIRYIVQYSILD